MTTVSSFFTSRLAAWPASATAARPVRSWADHPQLGCFPTAGEAAMAARLDQGLFAVLASRREDEASTLAALSVVACHLVSVVDRWARSGVPSGVLEDMDSELVVEALSAMASHPGWSSERVAQLAWQRVSGRRRTERGRARRHVTLDEGNCPTVQPHGGRVCLTASASLVTLAALSGWTASEATARLGISSVAWRARTSRARSFLRAELGVQ